jgi:Mn2+/Fe2+ NRAMP family transporter
MSEKTNLPEKIEIPPKGLAILALVGPSLVWCAEYIGSGEVILATRTGAILRTSVIWAIVFGIFLKYWIGMSGARYTVCTGEGMIDMFDRMPGPTHWAVWIVLVAQFIAGAISIGSLASAAGVFVNSLIPIPSYIAGWLVTILAFGIAWSGEFKWLKIIMSFLMTIILLGVLYVAVHVFPPLSDFIKGLFPTIQPMPEWAQAQGMGSNPWREILPLIGWGAGGFASQVWYTYWVMGANYGVADSTRQGQPADVERLKNLAPSDGEKIKGWCRVVYTDASIAVIIGITITVSFLIAGAGILGPKQIAPDGESVAITLSNIFSLRWGALGGTLFMLGGTAALISTQIGQLSGWPRLLADSFRICIPAFRKKFVWKTQFRIFLVFFFCSNMIIVYTLGYKPVYLVKIGAILDGLLLTPLQAIWIALGLYWVLPKLYKPETHQIIQPHWIFGLGLFIAAVVFGYFCIFQIPFVL